MLSKIFIIQYSIETYTYIDLTDKCVLPAAILCCIDQNDYNLA